MTEKDLEIQQLRRENADIRRECDELIRACERRSTEAGYAMNIHDATEAAYKRGYEEGKPKWISVNDRLPEPGVKVLVVNTAEEIYIAEYKWESFWLEPDYIDISIATHWMPLPEQPEVEK